MSDIMTVCGPVAKDALGFTSMHEHTLVDGSVFLTRFKHLVGGEVDEAAFKNRRVSLENLTAHRHNIALSEDNLVLLDEGLLANELNAFKEAGGGALLDVSPVGLRADMEAVRRVSEQSGVHIVCSTGFYAEDSWPQEAAGYEVENFAKAMTQEITEGIGGTGVFPGHIKVAMETDAVSPQEEKVLRAAVRVCRETGLSMTVHHGLLVTLEGADRILDLVKEENAPCERVIFCHQQNYLYPHDLATLVKDPKSWSLTLDHAKKVMDHGVNACIDCFGHRWDLEILGVVMPEDYHRMAGLMALIEAGYAPQLVVGTDSFVKIHAYHSGGEGYRRLPAFVAPTLLALGVSPEDVDRIFKENPARILCRAS